VQQFSQNYFQLFGLPQSFALDLDLLSLKYRELQVEAHPDRFARASEEEKLKAVQLSSLLNQAYDTLQTPLKRAAYLLQLHGLDLERVSQQDLGMDLLMEQMQLRETLDELPMDESALEQLEQLKVEVTDKLATRQREFATNIGNNELDAAKRGYHEMQFLQKLLQEIETGEERRLGY
jgi:molecular chaperone HscB